MQDHLNIQNHIALHQLLLLLRVLFADVESRNKVKWVKMNNKKQVLLMLEHDCSYSY